MIETAHLLPQPFKTLTSLISNIPQSPVLPPKCNVRENLPVDKRIFFCEIFAIDILTPTIDVEEDVPGHMASITTSNNSHVLLFLIFVLDSLLTYFSSNNDHQNYVNLVRSLEQGWFLTSCLFGKSFLLFAAIATHVVTTHFLLWSKGSLKPWKVHQANQSRKYKILGTFPRGNLALIGGEWETGAACSQHCFAAATQATRAAALKHLPIIFA